MMNGCDYAAGQKLIPEIIDKLNEMDEPNNRTWKQATMQKYVQVLEEKLAGQDLTTVEGELRDGPAGPISANSLSTRLYLKSYFSISNPNAVFSAFKKAEQSDNYIGRIYNPASEKKKTEVVFAGKIEKAWETNLNEERQGEIEINEDRFPLTVNPKKT